MLRRRWAVAAVGGYLVLASALPVSAGSETGFEDVEDSHIFSEPIAWLKATGVTKGCNPPANTQFCPEDEVTREQMAALLARSLNLAAFAGSDWFTDDNGSQFQDAINQIASAGITKGCNPPANTHFCPNQTVTRGEMAAFLVRSYGLTDTGGDWFADDDGSVFENEINQLAAAGVTKGCNPPANTSFCPNQPITRAQMAAFLWRAVGMPPAEPPLRLVAAGDISRCEVDSDEATASILDEMFANSEGFVAALGDTVYERGTSQEFRDCYEPSWGRHRFRTKPAVGNHEYRTSGASGYFDYFGAAAGDPDEGWYSYQLDGWQVIVLNSNCSQIGGCDTGSDQEQWLRSELQSSTAKCSIAYMHHPRFSSGAHGDDDGLTDFWSLFDEYGVEVVLAGHDHNYERLAPMTSTGEPGGVQSFVVGTGGTYLRPAETPRPGSEVLIDDKHGVLVLDLNQDSYEWRFIDTDSVTQDSGHRTCS